MTLEGKKMKKLISAAMMCISGSVFAVDYCDDAGC